ncbi:MAG: mismatch-specific DNA-glycosylase, partial [Candidatus Wallbacteria bacterium]|nr:mismatch-specific DNA-glycosylase [Candidatus Wallbacteria bacterium]
PGLKLLLVGINPGLYTAAVGHHFGRPGNRFWPALHAGGFTPRLYSPFEDESLLALGIGMTNVVSRSSPTENDLTREELREGGEQLRRKLRVFRPRWVAFLGIGAYRGAFALSRAAVGLQPETLEGARVWVLPNPSGLNAHYTLPRLAVLFGELREAIERSDSEPAR